MLLVNLCPEQQVKIAQNKKGRRRGDKRERETEKNQPPNQTKTLPESK